MIQIDEIFEQWLEVISLILILKSAYHLLQGFDYNLTRTLQITGL